MDNQKAGIVNALAAFFCWGIGLTISLKFLGRYEDPVSAMSIRIFWAFGLVFFIQLFRGKIAVILRLFNPKIFITMVGAASAISINWFVFIYAIQIHQLSQAALGYYILPLIGVLTGMVLFKEKLNRKQLFAIFLAGLGILWSIYVTGNIPLISLAVAFSFTFYGVIKRNIQFEPLSGLLLETLIMAAFTPVVYYFFRVFDLYKIMPSEIGAYLPAAFVAIFTILPLFFFARAVKMINYSLYSVLSWLVPSIQFVLSVFFWREEFDMNKLITFAFIWVALAIYGYSLFENKKAEHSNG